MVLSNGLLWKAPSGIVAISLLWKPLEDGRAKKTHERLRHKRTKPDLTALETVVKKVVKKVETQTNYAECQHLTLKYVQVC